MGLTQYYFVELRQAPALYATILTAQEIIENKAAIFSCAKAFREDASKLMLQLSRTFDFDINKLEPWPAYISETRYNKKGILDHEWTFYVHGSHCRFESSITGQIVEVRYTERPEFGCLDGYFFYNYMLTTNEFRSLAIWFADYTNVYDAIQVLSQEGTFTRVKSNVRDYIIAL
ncbi:MAG: hypothetical protein ABL929_12530 [Ferruginibacter sp.]